MDYDERRLLTLYEVYGQTDFGDKRVSIGDVPLLSLLKLKHHAERIDPDAQFNQSKWIKNAIDYFNMSMDLVEKIDGSKEEKWIMVMENLISSKPWLQESVISAMKEFITKHEKKD